MRDNECNELTVSAGESILLPATTQDVTITPEGGSEIAGNIRIR